MPLCQAYHSYLKRASLPLRPDPHSPRLHLDARHTVAVCILVDNIGTGDVLTNDCGFRPTRLRLVNDFIGRFGRQRRPFFIAVLVDKFLDVLFRGANRRGTAIRRPSRDLPAVLARRPRPDFAGSCRRASYLDLSLRGLVCRRGRRCKLDDPLEIVRKPRPSRDSVPQAQRHRDGSASVARHLRALRLRLRLAARASGPLSVRPALLVQVEGFLQFFFKPEGSSSSYPPAPGPLPVVTSSKFAAGSVTGASPSFTRASLRVRIPAPT